MKFTQRVINHTTDLSLKVGDYRSSAVAFAYTSGQYLYIGSEVPFNNVWIDLGAFNAIAATVDVDIWSANAWQDAVDVTDETAVSGVSLAQDGRISWSTEISKGWDVEQESANVTGLSGTKIYYMHWARLSWSASLSGSTTLKYIGQKFSTDTDLYDYYPDLNDTDLKEAFEASKADWIRQHYIAAEKIVNDLISKKIIESRGQILDWYLFREAACHKTAEMIYFALGTPFREDMSAARAAYRECMTKDKFRIDTSMNGRLDQSEKRDSLTYMRR